DGEVSLYAYDKDGMLVKAENSENLLEFTRDRKTGQIIEEKQGEYTVNRTYDNEGNCTRITSSLGADIRHTYDHEGNLQTMQAGESWQASWVHDNTGLEVQRTFSGGVTVRTERDCFGREIRKSVRSGGIEQGAYRYQWGIANRLLSKENELTGTVTRYDYDRFDFLIRQETMQGSETDVIYRVPDFVGNLFETPDKKDRKYGAGGKLLEDPDCFYHYDDEGNLIFREFKQLQETGVKFDRKHMEKERGIRCLATGTGWLYEWSSNGMLKKVIRPDGRPVEFRYDALGRRTAKQYFGKVTRWVWDGNVPIHEWSYKITDMQSDEKESTPLKEPTKDITTWVFEADTFVPTAKIQDGKQYSIVSDYLGTPIQMYDEKGNKTWDCTLDVYGKTTTFEGLSLNNCPFRYQGQYKDTETELYYNRFRYYSPDMGMYISSDPIELAGNNPTLYSYVSDSNSWVDIFGLLNEFGVAGYGNPVHAKDGFTAHELLQNAWLRNNNVISGRSSGIATSNPAIALQESMHKRISKLQANYGLHNPNVLKNQTALQNINRNTALTRRGIYEDLVSRGWDSANAKAFATKKAMELRGEAINFANNNGLIKGCH
ncbi:RHS repeat domain-containing protein, partial [Phocaeicola sartorii]|uniref:RHS repeat domain-containing protein n=1 Tax=Phocaeicola sartorii TaxID=671267 RepID=UPI0025A94840